MQQTAFAQGAFPNSPQWLTEYREKNHEIFLAKPVKKSKYTSIPRLEELLKAPAKGSEPKVSIKSGKGAKVIPLGKALLEMPQKLAEIISKEKSAKDQFEAFVNANFNTGFVVLIGKECEGETISLSVQMQENSCSKSFIIVEPRVQSEIIEEIVGNGGTLSCETIHIGEGGKIGLAKIHLEQGAKITCQQCIVEKDASLTNNNSWFGGELVRANTSNILEGPGSCANEYSLLLAKNKQHFDLNYSTIHRAPASSSHCVFNSALLDESRNVFDGMIRIEPEGDKTNALLECHAMILGNNASSNQIPGLEIKTDDVKATHSATVARIEDDELFYLESRGIPKDEARKTIVKSFLESIAFRLAEAAKTKIQAIIEKSL